MAKKLNSVLGVDIGSQAIKIAEVRLQGKTPTVTALGMAMTPEGAVDHIGIHDPDNVGSVLKQLCSASGASVGDVVVSVAGQGSVLVRTLEVPSMNDTEMKQHMDWEITRNIPFAESTVVSDYKAFPPEPNNPQNMDVVMAISPQSVVDTMIALMKKAGKKPAALDVEPLGIARSLMMSYGSEMAGKSVCVIDIGHKTTAINIYRDGKLLMPRQVPIGGEMVTRAIADGLGVSFEEAERIKTTSAEIPEGASVGAVANPFDTGAATQAFAPYNPFADPSDEPAIAPEATPEPEPAAAPVVSQGDNDRVFPAMAGLLDEFAAEVRRSVDYFRGKGGEVDTVVLSGGGGKLKGLAKYISTAVGLPVQQYDPLKNIDFSPKNPTGMDSHADFTVAIGNALHIAF